MSVPLPSLNRNLILGIPIRRLVSIIWAIYSKTGGELQEACVYYERALAINERVLGLPIQIQRKASITCIAASCFGKI